MKSAEEIMEILEGFDLTASYRDAAELAGCSPNTVARYVAAREAGTLVPGRAERRPSVIDGFLPKLEELVERSKGKIRADVAHDKIVAMGFAGSERSTRRAVAEIKKAWRSGRRRVHRPWVPSLNLLVDLISVHSSNAEGGHVVMAVLGPCRAGIRSVR